MKRNSFLIVIAATAALLFAACNQKNKADENGFYTSESGLKYKFEVQNEDAKIVQIGNVIEGEVLMMFEDDTIGTNFGNPMMIARVEEDWFDGGINEAFLMMHEGDKASFGILADSVAKFMQPNQMPPSYEQGKGMRYYYTIHITKVLTEEDLQAREAEYMAKMEENKNSEPERIAKYIADNNITAKPNKDGVYIIVKEQGNGKKSTDKSTVTVNYAGYLLDGKMFDTNIETVAKANGRPNGHFQPFTVTLGQGSVIPGWDKGLVGLSAGTKATLVIPSAMAYGATGAGNDIQPYEPLVFDVEILAVN